MSFTTQPRFNLTAFAFAAFATLTLNGTLLLGFDQLANTGNNGHPETSRMVPTDSTPTVALERVIISTRRA